MSWGCHKLCICATSVLVKRDSFPVASLANIKEPADQYRSLYRNYERCTRSDSTPTFELSLRNDLGKTCVQSFRASANTGSTTCICEWMLSLNMLLRPEKGEGQVIERIAFGCTILMTCPAYPGVIGPVNGGLGFGQWHSGCRYSRRDIGTITLSTDACSTNVYSTALTLFIVYGKKSSMHKCCISLAICDDATHMAAFKTTGFGGFRAVSDGEGSTMISSQRNGTRSIGIAVAGNSMILRLSIHIRLTLTVLDMQFIQAKWNTVLPLHLVPVERQRLPYRGAVMACHSIRSAVVYAETFGGVDVVRGNVCRDSRAGDGHCWFDQLR